MKQTFILVCALMVIASSFSCKKRGDEDPATGSIRYSNTSNYDYSIYLDDEPLGSVQGNTYFDVPPVKVGPHTVKVIQLAGYTTNRLDRVETVEVKKGEIVDFRFP